MAATARSTSLSHDAQDHDLLRAMFVATFEAVKTTSPLRGRVRAQLQSGAVKVEAGLRNGTKDGSIRPDVDIEPAVKDITAAVFGIAFQWVVVPGDHELEDELNVVRERITREYGPRRPQVRR